MDPLEDNTAASTSSSSRYFIILAAMIIIPQILISVISYPFLPDQIPLHWDVAGQVSGYMPKLFTTILFPAISLFLAVLARGLITVGPRLGLENRHATLKYTKNILQTVLVFMLVIQLLTIQVALKLPIG